jgi:glycosyltransferase involved in cell wall biosynthesis
MHGPVQRPQEALGEIGLLVLPSISEGMPMVLIEAMASGVPVLGRDVPGVRDVIENGRTGTLASSLSTGALAAEIRRVIEDAPLREQLSNAARAEVERRYTWGAVLDQYRKVLGMNF